MKLKLLKIQILEVKQGPYDEENDKKRFDNQVLNHGSLFQILLM